MNAVACAAVGYLIGTVNPSFLFSKLKGFDIRARGSGNAGATNAMLTMGKLIGAMCMILDIIKAFLAYKIGKILFPALRFAGILAGTCCILGHIFPVWMGFRGGKGLACIGGLILAHDWKIFCIMLAFEIVLVLVVNYICVMAVSASAIFTAVYYFTAYEIVGTAAMLIITIIVFFKHIENFQRIAQGTEFHFSYLWDKDREIERVTKILGTDRLDELA